MIEVIRVIIGTPIVILGSLIMGLGLKIAGKNYKAKFISSFLSKGDSNG